MRDVRDELKRRQATLDAMMRLAELDEEGGEA